WDCLSLLARVFQERPLTASTLINALMPRQLGTYSSLVSWLLLPAGKIAFESNLCRCLGLGNRRLWKCGEPILQAGSAISIFHCDVLRPRRATSLNSWSDTHQQHRMPAELSRRTRSFCTRPFYWRSSPNSGISGLFGPAHNIL